MKLSKQERIAAIVVVVLIILVAGVFLFIKPNIETIISTKETLTAKQKEYNDDVAKADQMDPLKDEIVKAYNEGKDTAAGFYNELPAYEADKKFREFLDNCGVNVLVEDLTVNEPTTTGLSSYVFTPTDVTYPLKDYVNQGTDAELDPRLVRQAVLMLVLGEAQTIGATTLEFDVQATSLGDLLAFADAVNNYVVTENGKSVRKNIEIDSFQYTDQMVIDGYDAMVEGLLAEAEDSAAEKFKEETGFDVSGYSASDRPTTTTPSTPTTPTTPAEGTGEEGGEGAEGGEGGEGAETPAPTTPAEPPSSVDTSGGVPLEWYYHRMHVTLTFYSVESMQDPAPTLQAQDDRVASVS